MKNKEVFTTGEVAKICKVSQLTIIRRFDEGKLKGFKVPYSRARRIPLEYLIVFMKHNGIPLRYLVRFMEEKGIPPEYLTDFMREHKIPVVWLEPERLEIQDSPEQKPASLRA